MYNFYLKYVSTSCYCLKNMIKFFFLIFLSSVLSNNLRNVLSKEKQVSKSLHKETTQLQTAVDLLKSLVDFLTSQKNEKKN